LNKYFRFILSFAGLIIIVGVLNAILTPIQLVFLIIGFGLIMAAVQIR